MIDTRIRPAPVTLQELTGDGTALILAPHADDESLGCGGVLAALFAAAPPDQAAPRPAHVVCLTDGAGSHPGSRLYDAPRLARQRRAELGRALVCLGGTPQDATCLDHPDRRLGTCIDEASRAILHLCDRIRPTALLAPSPHDHHADHVSAARIAARVRAARPDLRHWIYPVWSRWDHPDVLAQHLPARARSFDTAPWKAAKRRAIDAHASQLGRVVPDDPAGFVMDPDFVRKFVEEPELYFEAPPCP